MIPRLLGFALVLLLPFAATAQVTAHQVKISVKAVGQTTNDQDFDKFDRFSGNTNDVLTICGGGEPPARDVALFLFLDCSDVPLSLENNLLAIVDTNPILLLEEVGSVSFDTARFMRNESSNGLQSALVPVTMEFDCGAITLEGSGIMKLEFKDLDGTQCPNSASVKVTGVSSQPVPFIVDNGSSFKAQSRSAAFANQFPPEP
jgi:hypothetical protein